MEKQERKTRRKDFIRKWKAESPERNKKITNFCGTVVSIAGGILALPAAGFIIPTILLTYAGITVVVGGFVGFKSKMTVK